MFGRKISVKIGNETITGTITSYKELPIDGHINNANAVEIDIDLGMAGQMTYRSLGEFTDFDRELFDLPVPNYQRDSATVSQSQTPSNG